MIETTLRPCRAAPVLLFGGAFRQVLLDARASPSASLSLKDGSLSPIQLWNNYDTSEGLSLVILNLLETPLAAHHCLETEGGGHDDLAAVLQCRPGSIDFTKAQRSFCNWDQIPATVSYPNPSRHDEGSDGDQTKPKSLLSGVGFFQFFSNTGIDDDFFAGLAFSTTRDEKSVADKKGEYAGVAVRLAAGTFTFAVTANLRRYDGTSWEDKLRSLAQTNCAHAWNGTILVGAGWSDAPSVSKTLLVWVEDDPGLGGRPAGGMDDQFGTMAGQDELGEGGGDMPDDPWFGGSIVG